MLSRVAERIYWSARYLERVASTARLVSSYDNLLFDLPRSVKLSWYNLIIINDLEEAFNQRYAQANERNVVKFLLGEDDNPSSLVNALKNVKENVRTTRDVVPEEAWELICELSLYVQGNVDQGINRQSRHEFLEDVSKGCLQIYGLLFSSMPQDPAWEFFHLGRNLERADMTTRYLEAGLSAGLELEDNDNVINSQQVIWGSVLRALNGTQYYLRKTRTSVKAHEVITYLLSDPYFPKSIAHCIASIIHSCTRLPNADPTVNKLQHIKQKLAAIEAHDTPGAAMRDQLNQLQILLTGSHFIISEAWFTADN